MGLLDWGQGWSVNFLFLSHLLAGEEEHLGVLWMQWGCGNESQSAVGTMWEGNKHLERKSSIFSLEPIKFKGIRELSANLIKLK